MKMLRPAIVFSLILVSLTAALPVRQIHAATSTSTTPQSIEQVVRYGTTSPLQAAASTSSNNAAGNAATPAGAAQVGARLSQVNRAIPRPVRSTNAPTMALPAPPSNGVAGRTAGLTGFNGITNRQQELAGSGQYTLSQIFLEPPDQGLCAGNGSVIEAVNLALRVHTMSGTATSPVVPLNQFFRLPPFESRTNPTINGPFLSDPKCYYDSSTARWFLSTLDISTDPATGAFTDTSFQLLAVSQSSNPLGTWNLYRFETTDGSGATPGHPGCPCLGDQPLLGADRHGIYVTTNEFPITGPGFNGSQVYALSKMQLENGTASQVVHLDAGALSAPDGGIWYSIQPATSPGAQFESANNGTEYFLSALDFNNTGDNRVAAWALMNTASLDNPTPAVSLSNVIVGSETYIGSGASVTGLLTAIQKPGPTPLADFFNFYFHTNNGLEPVQGNDDRMNQVVFAAGKLWSGVNTAENGTGASANVGIAYFIVAPSSAGGTLTATMANQGYVSAGRDNVMYPSIGVTPAGKGVMSFSLIGPDFYPAAAYALVDAAAGAGSIHIAAAGAAPDDGFTGYNSPICPPGPCNNVVGGRWGDYSAAVADEQGRIWLGAEYIPNSPRLLFANWGTFISSVTP